jgi:hypothetical protein
MLLAALMAMAMQAQPAGGATGTAAPGTMAMFRKLCGDDAGVNAIRTADAMGWKPPPSNFLDGAPEPIKQGRNIQGRLSSADIETSEFFVMTADGISALGVGPTVDRICLIGGNKLGAVDQNLKRDIAQWLGAQQPSTTSADGDIYIFTDKSGSRKIFHEEDRGDAQAALKSGEAKTVIVGATGGVSLVLYMVPTQAN